MTSACLFSVIQSEQCLEWAKMAQNVFPGDRAMTMDNVRFVARVQKDGNDYLGYLLTKNYNYYFRDEKGVRFKSKRWGYPYQFLRIRDGCTVLYVHYKLDTPYLPMPWSVGTPQGVSLVISYINMHTTYLVPTALSVTIVTSPIKCSF